MDFLSGKKTGTTTKNLQTKYSNSINNLLLVVGFSAINIVLLAVNANTYFLFSAFIPYMAVDYGMYFCGMYPEEYYYDMTDMVFYDKTYLAIAVAVAVASLLIYIICWYFAKKKKLGAVITALVFFAIDTVAMIYFMGISADIIIDLLMHIWVIYYLVIAIVTLSKMKKEPIEEAFASQEYADDGEVAIKENTTWLRRADTEVKERVFLEAEVDGLQIVYRRVKHTNELIVNGYVYDEYVAMAEFAHTLTAVVNNHKVEAVFDGKARVFILVDGEEKAKKIRMY